MLQFISVLNTLTSGTLYMQIAMQHPRNPSIRLVRQLFVSFPHSARSFRNALIWQARWFKDVYRQSLHEQMLPGDWHLSGEGGGRCTRQL